MTYKPGDLICYTIKTRHVTKQVVREVERVSVNGGLVQVFMVGGGWMQGHMVELYKGDDDERA
jgi:hypothetical protein